jgi:hypothetical protein
MVLTISFDNADELRAKVLDLAKVFNGEQTIAAPAPDLRLMSTPEGVEIKDAVPSDTPPANLSVVSKELEPETSKPGKRGRPKKETTEIKEKIATPAPVAPTQPLSREQVKTALEQLNAARGITVVREILAKFNCSRLSEVKEEQFADFIAACQAG